MLQWCSLKMAFASPPQQVSIGLKLTEDLRCLRSLHPGCLTGSCLSTFLQTTCYAQFPRGHLTMLTVPSGSVVDKRVSRLSMRELLSL